MTLWHTCCCMRASVPEAGNLGRLLPFERRIARNAYSRWKSRLDLQQPGTPELNGERAGVGAYAALSGMWSMLWIPLLMVASLTFETNHLVTVVVSVIAVVPFAMFVVRLGQGMRAISRSSARPGA